MSDSIDHPLPAGNRLPRLAPEARPPDLATVALSRGRRDSTDSPCPHPTLLISVRDEEEAATAFRAGVGIVDLKEPRHGALAPVDAGLATRVVGLRDRSFPNVLLSAALGEPAEALAAATRLPRGIRFAKGGPSGIREAAGLKRHWQNLRRRLPSGTELVAVAYADHEAARTLPASQILAIAAECSLRHCLVDTFQKDGRSTLERIPAGSLRQLSLEVASRGQWLALAGSLRLEQMRGLLDSGIGPDCVGVRGAVCHGGREGGLLPELIASWLSVLEGDDAGIDDSAEPPSDRSVTARVCPARSAMG